MNGLKTAENDSSPVQPENALLSPNGNVWNFKLKLWESALAYVSWLVLITTAQLDILACEKNIQKI